jgi:DNA-binding transcriptional regulator YdaS (Cro superfamily)
MAKSTAQTRTLRRALELIGTLERLAIRLVVSPAELSSWISGAKPTPTEIYLRALDVVSHGLPPVSPDRDKR